MNTIVRAEQAPATRSARIAATMANKNTPLIKNCWYVLGWGDEFTREMKSRTVLGIDLVFFRSVNGRPLALQNRCPHRSMPLSKGTLEGDDVRCGYHGLLFDCAGTCLEVPSQKTPPPATARIDAFKCVETGPMVWVWMGDPADADERKIPDTSWLSDPDWAHARGYIHLEASYVGLHENLLDLSHFSYLHPGNVGTPEYAAAPFECKIDGDIVEISRFVDNCPVPGIFTKPTGMAPEDRISRLSASRYVSPGMYTAISELVNLAPKEDAQVKFTSHISHYMTPETNDSTHYYFTFARNFAIADKSVTRYIETQAKIAFGQDIDALLAIKDITEIESNRFFEEINLQSDQAGVAMRRILKRLADEEARS